MAFFQKIKILLPELFRYVLLVLVGIASVRKLIGSGFVPTHDGEYHIIRLWQFDKMFTAGYWFPRWAPDLDVGYGSPVLMFFYPLPNYIGEFFKLFGFSYIKSVHLVLASGLVLSAITFYIWMRKHVSPWSAFVSAISYVLVPYHLVDVFIRGSVGEVWALALVPLLLYSVFCFSQSDKIYKKYIGFIAISTAIVLLSHNLIGVLGVVFALAYGFVLLFQNKNFTIGVLLYYFLGFALGTLLTSFYYIPVALESVYVGGFNIVSVSDHFPAFFQLIFPSWGSGFSVPGIDDKMSFQIGMVHIMALIVAGILGFLKRNKIALFMVGISVITILFMLEMSIVIWNIIPGMDLIQYPWRLLSIIAITGSFCIGYVSDWKKQILVPLFLIAILGAYWNYTNAVVYKARNDDAYLSNPDWAWGTATLGDTFIIKQAIVKKMPAEQAVDIVQGNGEIKIEKKDPVTYVIKTISDEELDLQANINYYPGWKVFVDDVFVPINSRSGLISFTVPPGNHSIMILFGRTRVRTAGTIVSAVSFVAIGCLIFLDYYERVHIRRIT